MHSKLLFFFLWLVPIFVSAQVTQEWVQRYNSPQNYLDYASSIAVDAFGNVYVTGKSGNNTIVGYDYVTIKYNSSGVQQWLQQYIGPTNSSKDEACCIALDTSGSVYVTGNSQSNYATIKYNSSGVQQWLQRYQGINLAPDIPYAVAVDILGNIYVTGISDYDIATIKYNSAGIQQWVQRYNQPDNNNYEAHDIIVDGLSNVYVTGRSKTIGTPFDDYITIKYNSSGVQQWVQRYDGPEHRDDASNSIAVDASGNVFVTGYSGSTNTRDDYATIKYNSSGVLMWVQRYNGTGNFHDRATSIAVDDFGNAYVTGESYGDNNASYDFVTIKYNSSGIQQWVQRYASPGQLRDDKPHSMVVDISGNVYVTGESAITGTGIDFTTIKYGTSGVQQWIKHYNGPGTSEDIPASIAIDTSGNVYTTGVSMVDYLTIKYSQNVGIQQTSTEIPNQFSLGQNYPNPFNPTTIIKFDIPQKSFVNLVIYNSLGKEVATLVNDELAAGSYQTDWNAGGYPSGVYFYRIQTDDFVQTRSMVLLK